MNDLRSRLTMTVALALLPITTAINAAVNRESAMSTPAVTSRLQPAPAGQDRRPDSGPQQRATGKEAEPVGGSYTRAQAERGRKVYLARCGACHGAAFVPDDFSPGLKGAAFEWRWKSRTAYDLFESIRTTMPLGEAGTLGPRETADIVAFLLQVNGFRSGSTELSPEREALQRLSLKR